MSMDKMMLLAVAYSANLGGLGMLTGTAPNLVLKCKYLTTQCYNCYMSTVLLICVVLKKDDQLRTNEFRPSHISAAHVDSTYGSDKLTFLNWSAYCIPTVSILLVIAWVWLQIWFMGFNQFFKCGFGAKKTSVEKRIEKLMRDKYNALGKIKFAEIVVLILFGLLVILWFARAPGFAPGYGNLFEVEKNETKYEKHEKNETKTETNKTKSTYFETYETKTVDYVKDAVPAVLIPMLLFVLPSEVPSLSRRATRLLDWKTTQDKMPWNVIMLLGGGFALAKGLAFDFVLMFHKWVVGIKGIHSENQ
jgi:sodium-dependent dicarboxylate transporter 2/3/5